MLWCLSSKIDHKRNFFCLFSVFFGSLKKKRCKVASTKSDIRKMHTKKTKQVYMHRENHLYSSHFFDKSPKIHQKWCISCLYTTNKKKGKGAQYTRQMTELSTKVRNKAGPHLVQSLMYRKNKIRDPPVDTSSRAAKGFPKLELLSPEREHHQLKTSSHDHRFTSTL